MKKKIAVIFMAAMILLAVILTGCSGGGIAQADYDAVQAQLTAVQAQLDQAQNELASAVAEGTASADLISSLQEQVDDLNSQIIELNEKYSVTGATTLETVSKMAKAYYDSHFYIRNVYDCNNYASDFWDMLKQAGISSVIVVGNQDAPVTDILNTNHAWLMVDLGNGEKVAVDPTGGMVMTRTEHPYYYQGWTFNTPADLKANDDLTVEYNTRVSLINTLVPEINDAMNLYNNSISQADADKYLLLYNKLKQLKTDQEALLAQLQTQIESLATKL